MARKPRMIRNQTVMKLGGFSLATAARLWMGTLDYQAAYYDPTVDSPRDDFQGPVIYVLWHDQLLLPIYLRGRNNNAILVSQHTDGQWLSGAARHLGFEVIRGSSRRGGVAALRELMRSSRGMNLAVTPDGPRGPRRVMAPGVVYLSSKLQIPLVCMGSAYQRPWRLPTWDRFALPKPFTRARAVLAPRMQIPPKLDRDGVEEYRGKAEAMLNFVTDKAQEWADHGGRYAEQWPVSASPARKRPFGKMQFGAEAYAADCNGEVGSMKLKRAA